MLSNVKEKGKAIFKVISSFLSSYPLAKLGFHLLKYIVPLQNFNRFRVFSPHSSLFLYVNENTSLREVFLPK